MIGKNAKNKIMKKQVIFQLLLCPALTLLINSAGASLIGTAIISGASRPENIPLLILLTVLITFLI